MSFKKDKKYLCSYCGKPQDDPYAADECRSSHDLVYLAISADDLNILHNLLYSGDTSIITPSLVNAVKSLVGRAVRGKTNE